MTLFKIFRIQLKVRKDFVSMTFQVLQIPLTFTFR